MKYKVGDKVMIVSCEMHPQYVGKIGKVESILGTDDNALVKVSCKGKMIPDYATEDCLKRIGDLDDFFKIVKRMREAQKEWETDLANGYDEHWGKSWEKDRLEREVDEYLKKIEV